MAGTYANRYDSPQAYAEAVQADAQAFHVPGSNILNAAEMAAVAQVAATKTVDEQTRRERLVARANRINLIAELPVPADVAEYGERCAAINAMGARLGIQMVEINGSQQEYVSINGQIVRTGSRYELRDMLGNALGMTGSFTQVERELRIKASDMAEREAYEQWNEQQNQAYREGIRQASAQREFMESGADTVAELRAELASVKAELAALRANPQSQPQAAPVAPEPVAAPAVPVEYAPGPADDEPASEAERGLFDSAKTGLADLVAKYAGR